MPRGVHQFAPEEGESYQAFVQRSYELSTQLHSELLDRNRYECSTEGCLTMQHIPRKQNGRWLWQAKCYKHEKEVS